jgi:hypothetical protein
VIVLQMRDLWISEKIRVQELKNPRHCNVLALMLRCLNALLDYLPVL